MPKKKTQAEIDNEEKQSEIDYQKYRKSLIKSNLVRIMKARIGQETTHSWLVGETAKQITIIKAQPKWMFSICKYMEIYLGDLKKKKEDNQLMQLRGVCENMIIVNNESLNDVTEEEFIRKSEESLRESVNTSRRNSLKDLKG